MHQSRAAAVACYSGSLSSCASAETGGPYSGLPVALKRPPWLLEPITILPVEEPITILPVEVPEFHILPIDGDTQFVPESVDASPASLIDVLRSR